MLKLAEYKTNIVESQSADVSLTEDTDAGSAATLPLPFVKLN